MIAYCRYRHSCVAHRPLRLDRPTYQPCTERHHAAHRYGHRQLPDHVIARFFFPPLVRLICPQCKQLDGKRLAPDGEMVDCYRGAGCDHCFGSGYTRGASESSKPAMELNDELRKMIIKNEDAASITLVLRRNGMRNLREDGWMKVAQGVTTSRDEVMRVTQEF